MSKKSSVDQSGPEQSVAPDCQWNYMQKYFELPANLLRIVRTEMLKITNGHSDTRESKKAKLTVCQTLHSKQFLKVHKFVQERSQKLKGAGIQTSKREQFMLQGTLMQI